MAPNADPTVVDTPLPIRAPSGVLATPTFHVETWEMCVKATMATVQVPVPAGRYLVTATISPAGSTEHPPPASSSVDTGQIAAGNVTVPALFLRVLRQIGSAGSVTCAVTIHRHDGSGWVPWATTWGPAGQQQAVPAAAASPSGGGLPRWGSQIHLVIPSSSRAPGPSQTGPDSTLGAFFQRRMDRAAALGVKVLRTSVPWSFVQPTTLGTWDTGWGRTLDAYVTAAASHGIQLLVELGSGPPAYDAADGVNATSGPKSWADYETFVTSAVNRIGAANIVAVEGINEPNASSVTGFYANPANIVAETSHLRTAVKAISAGIKVLGPAIAFGDAAYLTSLYNAGLAGLTDAVAIHPYPIRFTNGPGTPAKFGPVTGGGMICSNPAVPWGDQAGDPYSPVSGAYAIHEVMRAHGEGANEVWLTEMGMSTSFTGAGKTHTTTDTGEASQAAWLTRCAQQAARVPFIGAFLWYQISDTVGSATDLVDGRGYSDPVTVWNRWGLVTWDGMQAKPAYAAYQAVIANGGA